MATAFAPIPAIPEALHRAEKDLPFVEYQEGVVFQLLQADVAVGLWVIRVRFQPGVTIQRHRHTGEVFAFTLRARGSTWNIRTSTRRVHICSSLPARSIRCMCRRRIQKSPMSGSPSAERTSTWMRRATSKVCSTPALYLRSTRLVVKRAGRDVQT